MFGIILPIPSKDSYSFQPVLFTLKPIFPFRWRLLSGMVVGHDKIPFIGGLPLGAIDLFHLINKYHVNIEE